MLKKLSIAAIMISLMLLGCGMPSETLKTVGSEGIVKIIADPGNADVYVDGNYIGKAYRFNGNPELLKLAHGTHTIELKKDGYQTYTTRIFVGNQAIDTVNIMLIKNP